MATIRVASAIAVIALIVLATPSSAQTKYDAPHQMPLPMAVAGLYSPPPIYGCNPPPAYGSYGSYGYYGSYAPQSETLNRRSAARRMLASTGAYGPPPTYSYYQPPVGSYAQLASDAPGYGLYALPPSVARHAPVYGDNSTPPPTSP
jgi:hypothetical protein